MKANRAYKFRIYPNTLQKESFAKTFGCVRFIYNKMLSDKIDYYKETGKMLINTPAQYKKEFEFLKEVDSLALSNAQLQLQAAYKNFFRDKSVGFPKFKSKKYSRQSYTTNLVNGNIKIMNGKIRLPKVGEIRIKLHREIPLNYDIKSVTISKESTGKYFVSVLTEYEAVESSEKLDKEKSLGLDYSSPYFYVDSNGNTSNMPHFYREAESKLAREQRKLSKMAKGSNNYYKQKRKVALAYEKVRNCRNDFQHKESKRLSDVYDYICVEEIDYKAMAQGLRLAKATNDNAFGQFRTYLVYKLQDHGKKLITIDKWYPSSKTCRHCGYVNDKLTIADRKWSCPACGSIIGRDINAAINIKNEGLRMIS
ncbi:MAG: transposase [Clostridia bacterium]|nr:transposase [Clostridia bacterium]